jgi:hypothetical protein
MFNVEANPTFIRPVEVLVPNGLGTKSEVFQATFRPIDDEEAEGVSFLKVSEIKDFLRKVIVSFDELCDEQGKPVVYSAAVLEGMLGLAYVRQPLLMAYTKAVVGERLGN